LLTAIFSATNISLFIKQHYPYEHVYSTIYSDLRNMGAEYLYCYNDYEFCGQIAFLAQLDGDKLIVQLFDISFAESANRHPFGNNKVDNAVKEGKKVYSLVPDFLIWHAADSGTPIKEYVYGGVTRYGLLDFPVSCVVDGRPEGVDKESGMYLRNCGKLINEYNAYIISQSIPK
jgi:hypothetical protein